jgi:hypothetical protein
MAKIIIPIERYCMSNFKITMAQKTKMGYMIAIKPK